MSSYSIITIVLLVYNSDQDRVFPNIYRNTIQPAILSIKSGTVRVSDKKYTYAQPKHVVQNG